jgi:hypothetical protein
MLARLLLLVCSLLLSLVLAEGAVRLLVPQQPPFMEPDPLLGRRLRPGAEGWWTAEGRGYVRVNAAGFRDRDHALEPAPGAYRVAVLGDSYVEAFQVMQEEAFWSVAEQRLRATCRPTAEVLGFGVSGYGPREALLLWRAHAAAYHPDIVVFAMTVYNDVADTDPSIVPPLEYGWEIPLPRTVRTLAQRGSALAALAVRVAAPRPTPASQSAATRERNRIYQVPDARWARAWMLSESYLLALRAEVEAAGARFMLTQVTTQAQVHPDPAFRARLAAAFGVPDTDEPRRQLARFATAHRVDWLDLVPPLRARAERDGAVMHGFPPTSDDGHWNVRGHAAAGEALAEHLCAPPSPALASGTVAPP